MGQSEDRWDSLRTGWTVWGLVGQSEDRVDSLRTGGTV